MESMGKFTAIGMRTPIREPNAMIINTCSDNDTTERGSETRWSWSNPTNRAHIATYRDITATSTEAMWQGTKIFTPGGEPDERTLAGEWRRGKAKRPIGAYAGIGEPLITSPGEARRQIYLPAFRSQIERWLQDPIVAAWVEAARNHDGPIYLRDFDTGRGVDRNGPMSHAWVLATFLNTGQWPTR